MNAGCLADDAEMNLSQPSQPGHRKRSSCQSVQDLIKGTFFSFIGKSVDLCYDIMDLKEEGLRGVGYKSIRWMAEEKKCKSTFTADVALTSVK